MRIGMLSPQLMADGAGMRLGWDEVQAFVLAADATAIDSVWLVDHLGSRGEVVTDGIFECWTTLAALASTTREVTIGPLVSCAGFRNPGLLAKMAATVAEISGGRLVLGLGAGSFAQEHAAFGFPTEARVDRLEEALRVIWPLIRGDAVSFDGGFYSTRDAVLMPPPLEPIPLMVGGASQRVLGLTARFADAWNGAWFGWPSPRLQQLLERLDLAAAGHGRDPATLRRTVGVSVDYDPNGTDDRSHEIPVRVRSSQALVDLLTAYVELNVDEVIVSFRAKRLDALEVLAAAAVAIR